MFTDEVVCIDASNHKLLKEGGIYPLLSMIKSPCKCKTALVDVGVRTDRPEGITCTICGEIHFFNTGGNALFKASRFAPIDSVDISEALEVLGKDAFKI